MSSCGFLLPLGNREMEGGTFAWDGFEPDAAAMALDDLLGDGKADAVAFIGAAVVQPLEHLEYLFRILLVEADTVIGYGDLYVLQVVIGDMRL